MNTFAVILVPLYKDRCQTENNVDKFSSLMNLYDPDFLYDESVVKNLDRLGKPSADILEEKRPLFLAKYLNMFPFFSRVSAQDMANKYIKNITIIDKKKDDLVIIPPND